MKRHTYYTWNVNNNNMLWCAGADGIFYNLDSGAWKQSNAKNLSDILEDPNVYRIFRDEARHRFPKMFKA